MTMKLERTLLQWANMNPQAIASCSAAAVTFLAADAQKDIASLASELATQRSLSEALEAENARLRGKIEEALSYLDGEPEYHDQGMGCGLEDRGITDRYDAMAHGWEQAMERVYSENIAWAKDALSTSSHVSAATE